MNPGRRESPSRSGYRRGSGYVERSIILDKAETGTLKVRGRRSGSITYEDISRDIWKVAFINFDPDKATLWRDKVKPRAGLTDEEIEAKDKACFQHTSSAQYIERR